MDVKDSISVTLKTIDGKETKDQSAKNIFSYKPIMSNILKYMSTSYVSYTKPIFEVIKIPKILEKSSFFACVESKCVI